MSEHPTTLAATVPICPKCGNPLLRVVDVPYGWWEWNDERGEYVACTAASRVDVAPWVHVDCWGELRRFHPQDPVRAGVEP